MQMESYFQLINPLIFSVFAVALFFIGRSRQELRSAYDLAMGYLFIACAFTFDIVRGSIPVLLGSVVINGLYMAALIFLTIGVARRVGKPIPMKALALVSLLHVASFLYFTFVYDDFWLRTLSLHFGSGLLIGIGAIIIWRKTDTALDRAINVALALTSLQMFVRPVLIGALFGAPDNIEAYTSSGIFFSLHLVAGVCAISLASLFIASYASQIVTMLRREANTDPLTGLLNRRGFRVCAAKLAEQVQSEDEALFVILADLDRFKQVNDTYGHGFGDELICKTADLFKCPEHVRAYGGRLGGEEFALIFVATSLVQAVDRAESLRQTLAAMQLKTKAGRKSFTASFGVAQLTHDGSLTAALEHADEALYLAKKGGRNRVATHQDVVLSKLQKLAPRGPQPSFNSKHKAS